MPEILESDLCVIGGGAAGLVVSAGGAAFGARVVLVEKNRLGGDCLYRGCVPSKALLKAAKVCQTLREADAFGFPSIDLSDCIEQGMNYAQKIIRDLEPNDSPERFEKMGVKIVWGAGQFISPDRFSVPSAGMEIAARSFVIATGSRPYVPDIPGLSDIPYLTNETVFQAQGPIRRLLVLGGGPISCELSQAFVRLGVPVTVVVRSPRILSREDPDLARIVKKRLEIEGVEYHLERRVLRAEKSGNGVALVLEGPDGRREEKEGSHLLVATGRTPNLHGLDLDRAGVKRSGDRLDLDRRLRTSNRRIFACGDAAGPHYYTHMAEHQASVVLVNTLFRLPVRAKNQAPRCTFTEPELAVAGLTEEEADRKNISYRVYRVPFGRIDRAVTDGEAQGFAKALTDSRGRLLGAGIVGPHAGELIHQLGLAIRKKMKLTDLDGLIHIYPTLSQIHKRLAQERLKAGMTPGIRRLLQRIFGLRGGWEGQWP